jgi:hypothetical protein
VTVDSATCTCGHHASMHAVDDEERRDCIHCDCSQFECSVDHDATGEPCPARPVGALTQRIRDQQNAPDDGSEPYVVRCPSLQGTNPK